MVASQIHYVLEVRPVGGEAAGTQANRWERFAVENLSPHVKDVDVSIKTNLVKSVVGVALLGIAACGGSVQTTARETTSPSRQSEQPSTTESPTTDATPTADEAGLITLAGVEHNGPCPTPNEQVTKVETATRTYESGPWGRIDWSGRTITYDLARSTALWLCVSDGRTSMSYELPICNRQAPSLCGRSEASFKTEVGIDHLLYVITHFASEQDDELIELCFHESKSDEMQQILGERGEVALNPDGSDSDYRIVRARPTVSSEKAIAAGAYIPNVEGAPECPPKSH